MRYNEAMNSEPKKPESKDKKKEEKPVKAGEKGYDYSNLHSSKTILTGRGKI